MFENLDEIVWVKSLFFKVDGYLDVYDIYSFVCECVVFGYGIYFMFNEWVCLGESGVMVVFCLIFNLFLGSGFFDMIVVCVNKVYVVMVMDVGVGIMFNMFKIYGDVYKVS